MNRRLSESFLHEPAELPRCGILEIGTGQEDGLPQEHYNLVLTNFEPTKYTNGMSPYDVTSRGDVLQSPEYVSDIYQRLFQSEVR